jgi:thiol-disulfide isomerase/thioredoxin
MRRFGIILGGVLLLTLLGLLQLFVFSADTDLSSTRHEIKTGSPYQEIVNPSGFVNTEGNPVTLKDYVGTHVILLEFMTYTCVNCQRTFPYVVEWYEKYKEQGLMVIGVHTPEYAFEKEIGNVEKAMAKSKITFPVVLDNEYSTWNAYGNRFWPHRYLIDRAGNVIYDHAGEGAYAETEDIIKVLLSELHSSNGANE